ncbi:cytidine deaminase-like protein [Massarina eburnea CBS 473.64]|uniref:Cytosine deaminase n=1 Tax=Massarina eburnea CBS 473.64 TaxID=1395130 RepID=A0A6A6RLD5_9PLEO|nr:cytidine deaminase-like protein [Massarina eburnea CBS 473.64]
METDAGFKAALEEAQKGCAEGGVPIGACLISSDGKVLGRGHNMRIQNGSPTLHAEISALEHAGRLSAAVYRDATMYTTLSPCDMCTGACVMYKVKRVVIGENKTFVGGEDYLRSKGIEVVVLKSNECEELMTKFIKEKPEDWYEDIGEDEK